MLLCSGVIDFDFPDPVPSLAELVKILFLDLRNIIKLGVHSKPSSEYTLNCAHDVCCCLTDMRLGSLR